MWIIVIQHLHKCHYISWHTDRRGNCRVIVDAAATLTDTGLGFFMLPVLFGFSPYYITELFLILGNSSPATRKIWYPSTLIWFKVPYIHSHKMLLSFLLKKILWWIFSGLFTPSRTRAVTTKSNTECTASKEKKIHCGWLDWLWLKKHHLTAPPLCEPHLWSQTYKTSCMPYNRPLTSVYAVYHW